MGRPLSAAEAAFASRYFGGSLALGAVRVGTSLGRRCWSPYASRISLTRTCFVERDPRNDVWLDDARVCATFAHELLHVWQRQRGVRVTLKGAWLQTQLLLRWANPYRYQSAHEPEAMLAQFIDGNIEQQGQIFEDYVFADRTAAPTARFAAIAEHVRSGARS